jgi:hypothetical protein
MAKISGTLARRSTRFPLNDLKSTEVSFDASKDVSSLKLTFSDGSVHLDLPTDETKYLTGIGNWLMRQQTMNIGGDLK